MIKLYKEREKKRGIKGGRESGNIRGVKKNI